MLWESKQLAGSKVKGCIRVGLANEPCHALNMYNFHLHLIFDNESIASDAT